MGYEYDVVHCGQCGELVSFTYDRTFGDFVIICPICGFYYEKRPMNDGNWFSKSTDERELLKEAEGNNLTLKTYISKGFGGYLIRRRSGAALGNFDEPVTKERVQWFQESMTSDDVDPEKSFLTQWNDESKEAEAIIGTICNPFGHLLNKDATD